MPPTEPDRMTAMETWAWGRFGSNGINSDVKRHSKEIGDLYGRDETLRTDIDKRMSEVEKRLSDGLTNIYRMIAGLLGAVLVSAVGVILSQVFLIP